MSVGALRRAVLTVVPDRAAVRAAATQGAVRVRGGGVSALQPVQHAVQPHGEAVELPLGGRGGGNASVALTVGGVNMSSK